MSHRYGRYVAASGRVVVAIFLALAVLVAGEAKADQPAMPPTGGNEMQSISPTLARNPGPYSPQCSPAESREDAEYCEQRRSADAAVDQARWSLWQLIVGTIGIVLVVGTLVFTVRATQTAERATRIAEQGLIADKRAFVFAEGALPFYHLQSNGEYWWRFRPNWHNSGDTPTRQLSLSVNCELRSTPLPIGFNFDAGGLTPGTGMLGPHSTSMGGECPPPTMSPLSVQDVEDMISGKRLFYMWGWVKYHDVFPNSEEHITRFCWQITAAGDPSSFTPEIQTVRFGNLHHAEGNCADNECRAP